MRVDISRCLVPSWGSDQKMASEGKSRKKAQHARYIRHCEARHGSATVIKFKRGEEVGVQQELEALIGVHPMLKRSPGGEMSITLNAIRAGGAKRVAEADAEHQREDARNKSDSGVSHHRPSG